MLKAMRVASQLGCAPLCSQWDKCLRPLKTRCNEPPYYQDYDRANDCADETSVLAGLIPPNRLAKVCCYKSSNNPQHGCQNKPRWLVLVARMKEPRDHPCHKPNYDGPKNTHCDLLLVGRSLCACTA